jgi:hypothetical protein
MLNKQRKQLVLEALRSKTLVKVISGIKNYDKQKVLSVAVAAEFGGASAVDICDDPEIIKSVRGTVQLPLFISSVDPLKLIAAVSYGADVLEIGNYENFYKEYKMFTAKEILETFQFVKKSVSPEILTCVTVPATLEINNQIKLAKDLIKMGADFIQTEGFTSDISSGERNDPVFVDILKAVPTIANTIEIKKAFPNAHIITASGITPVSVPLAFAGGASGVGVGTYVNSLETQAEMTTHVKEIIESISTFTPKYLQGIKTPLYVS